jgi:tRNA modification GTPase
MTKRFNDRDIIAAVATGPAAGAVGIVRVSGPGTHMLLSKIFYSRKKHNTEKMPERTMVFGEIRGSDGSVIDEVMACAYTAPRSYTGEDSAEIFGHGGIYNMNMILDAAVAAGARQAGPGEFTRRAFLNGKMDLTAAEAVAEMVCADNDAEHQAAAGQLKGNFYHYIRQVKEELTGILAVYEAGLEYPEEEHENPDTAGVLLMFRNRKDEISRNLEQLRLRRSQHDGLRIVIAGKTNAGKSSLLNLLLGRERAIVSDIHGTTRDSISERTMISGIPVILHDTAGIKDRESVIDDKALEQSELLIRDADLVLLVFDKNRKIEKYDIDLVQKVKSTGRRFLSIVNKTDLPAVCDLKKLGEITGDPGPIEVSVRDGVNIGQIRDRIHSMFSGPAAVPVRFIYSERYEAIFERLSSGFGNLISGLEQHAAYDRMAYDLKGVLSVLAEITGEVLPEDVLDIIFSRFCVGK